MKVACLSYFLPDVENRGGPCSLLYQLLAHRPATTSVDLFVPAVRLDAEGSSAVNRIRQTLGISVTALAQRSRSRQNGITRAWWPSGARMLADCELPPLEQYDLVWGYPYWTAPVVRHLQTKVLVSGMDSAALLYWRRLRTHLLERRSSIGSDVARLVASAAFEFFFMRHLRVHTVGAEDARALRRIGAKAVFVSHPLVHYPLADARRAGWRNARPRILLSNPGDAFYGSRRAGQWLESLATLATHRRWNLSLILHKPSRQFADWAVEHFVGHRYVTVETAPWLNDYSGFLNGIDIQLFPLDIGAGTKTSVLTALQHGVVAVGTSCAFENVEGEPRFMHRVGRDGDFPAAFNAAMEEAATVNVRETTGRPDRLASTHGPDLAGARFWQMASDA